jgi:hypothetical protein
MGSQQKFSGKIANGSGFAAGVGRRGADPALQEVIPNQVRQRHVVIMSSGKSGKLALNVKEAVEKLPFDLFLV